MADLKGKSRATTTPADGCALCSLPLLVPQEPSSDIEDDEDEETPSHLIDDVELPCGDHFHWDCLMNASKISPVDKLRFCLFCRQQAVTIADDGSEKLLVHVRNEGGLTSNFDLGEEIRSEIAFDSNPHLRRTEAFLSLMSQDDLETAEEMLRGEDGAEPVDPNSTYEEGGLTALHVAAYNNNVRAIELLLRYGAQKDKRSNDGASPLDCASQVEAWNAVQVLNS
ncbi:Zinc finger, RING/FYVE/PHD-type [Phaffia rhodozyma]|uniref:Zinc finger, RING/FYVE/PHD-type n=1 Tax=Phaffia rhodozyma TaxID=264483 RepID=A0A0F7SXY8_PHARH|nr:Zinc finger, RING/FYVE/PHD-type [Phaffia rhodozyma]